MNDHQLFTLHRPGTKGLESDIRKYLRKRILNILTAHNKYLPSWFRDIKST
jgi:hypothetical protein